MRLADLRRVTRTWTGLATAKMSAEECRAALGPALKDSAAAARVLASLSKGERDVVSVYRRYGGTVDGAVLRAELLVRGLVQTVQHGHSNFPYYRWKSNPVSSLAERLVLLAPGAGSVYPGYFSGYGSETQRPFPTYTLPAGIGRHAETAGPPPWQVAPLTRTPQALGQRSPVEVVLGLSAVFAALAGRGSLALNKSGDLSASSLRSLVKAVHLAEDQDYPLPDPQGMYFELLRGVGLVVEEGDRARADPAAATRFFAEPAALQAHRLARAWVHTPHWADGLGMVREGPGYESGTVPGARQLLAWALGCLARQEEEWFGVAEFLTALFELCGTTVKFPGWGGFAWKPRYALDQQAAEDGGRNWERSHWFKDTAPGLANALLITLPALGLAERGRSGRSQGADCFRLTAPGRAVFGAPEVAIPPEEPEQPFLVVQPNFDVVAYLDRAGARSAGLLGRVAEAGPLAAGPVQTFRLTRDSVYRALEGGLSQEQLADFLTRSNQGPLPANVLRALSDWGARREGLVLRQGLTLLAFPNREARDGWLTGHTGTACGEHFVLAGHAAAKDLKKPTVLADHLEGGRYIFQVDENGVLHTDQPVDVVQRARLRRMAEPDPAGWRLTRNSVRRALARGMKPAPFNAWLEDLLHAPVPPLLACALDAWWGEMHPAELGEAILLHVANPVQFHALASSPRLRPFLNGSPGPGWLMVRPEARKTLSGLLVELGFELTPELTPASMPTLVRIGLI